MGWTDLKVSINHGQPPQIMLYYYSNQRTKDLLFKMKKTPIILGGLLAALAVPVIASTQNESPVIHSAALLPNQVEFLKLVDKESGTNLSSLKNDSTAIMLVQASARACNNIGLQKQVISALGGNESDANYASSKFQSVFCKNTF